MGFKLDAHSRLARLVGLLACTDRLTIYTPSPFTRQHPPMLPPSNTGSYQ